MPAPRPTVAARPAPARLVTVGSLALLAVLAVVLLAACSASPGGGGSKLLHYQRVWPDGRVEQETVYSNGHVDMKHGETLERMTLSSIDVTRLQDALKEPIPTGSPDDSPVRTLELTDGTVIEAPRPDPGTVTELLERLLNQHSLG